MGCVLGKLLLLLALFSVTGVRLAEQVSPEKATVFQSCPHSKCCVSIYLSITLCVCVCRDLNGTSTTKPIMIPTIHHRKLFKDTNSTSALISPYHITVVVLPLSLSLSLCRFSFPISSTSDRHHLTQSHLARTTPSLVYCGSMPDHLMRYNTLITKATYISLSLSRTLASRL